MKDDRLDDDIDEPKLSERWSDELELLGVIFDCCNCLKTLRFGDDRGTSYDSSCSCGKEFWWEYLDTRDDGGVDISLCCVNDDLHQELFGKS